MLQQPISRSPDLKRLQDEGFDLEIKSGWLLVKDVPYLNSRREVKRGTLASKLSLAGDITVRPDDHVAYFAGEYPCRGDGTEIDQIRHQSGERSVADGVVMQHSFSARPKPTGVYDDYYAKVTTYVAILSSPAQGIDPSATAKTFPIIQSDPELTPFNYLDTASSRAEINVVTDKLEKLKKITIV